MERDNRYRTGGPAMSVGPRVQARNGSNCRDPRGEIAAKSIGHRSARTEAGDVNPVGIDAELLSKRIDEHGHEMYIVHMDGVWRMRKGGKAPIPRWRL